MSELSYYKWKSKYCELDLNEAKRMKVLEDENRKLKQMLADLMLDQEVLKDLLSKYF